MQANGGNPTLDCEQAVLSANFELLASVLAQHHDFLLTDLKASSYLMGLAANKNQVKCLEVLVAHGADVNASNDNDNPEGPIKLAASFGAFEAVEWLLKKGARINLQKDGITRCFALSGAARNGHLKIVKLLVVPPTEQLPLFGAEWVGEYAFS
jgi:ankyrin repeat protein